MKGEGEGGMRDGLILKRIRGGGGEAHENCMGPTLPLVKASHTVHT